MVKIFKNTGSDFAEFQTILTDAYVFNVGVSEDGQIIGYEAENLFLYEESGGEYRKVQ